jgi:hypothetical protein
LISGVGFFIRLRRLFHKSHQDFISLRGFVASCEKWFVFVFRASAFLDFDIQHRQPQTLPLVLALEKVRFRTRNRPHKNFGYLFRTKLASAKGKKSTNLWFHTKPRSHEELKNIIFAKDKDVLVFVVVLISEVGFLYGFAGCFISRIRILFPFVALWLRVRNGLSLFFSLRLF